MAIEFTETFDREDPEAVASFRRSFTHKDWVDGVDVIQAGSNGAEAGFNLRFNNIQKDLDGVGKDAAQALKSMATARRQLSDVILELKGAINTADGSHSDAPVNVAMPAGWFRADQIGQNLSGLSYLKDRSGVIHLRGVVTTSQSPSADPGLLLFTLPAGFQPEFRVVLGAFSGAGTTRVDVQPDGKVLVRGSISGSFGSIPFVSLDGLCFRSKGGS